MDTQIKLFPLIFSFALFSANPVYATSSFLTEDLYFKIAGGVTWMADEDTSLVISPSETDTNHTHNTSVGGAWNVGVGFPFLEDSLAIELNLYGVSNTVEGEVWQYELLRFNNYTFSAPISSTRLMLDFKPSFVTSDDLSAYLIMGFGVAWNTASYYEEANPGTNARTAQSLSENTETVWAWDLGLGFDYEINEKLSLTAEYIYGFLKEAYAENNAVIIEAPQFSYQPQTFLLGLSFKI